MLAPDDSTAYRIYDLEPVDDVHTSEKPFCYDICCSCHEDDLLIAQVYLYMQDGLMTPPDAVDFVVGKGI